MSTKCPLCNEFAYAGASKDGVIGYNCNTVTTTHGTVIEAGRACYQNQIRQLRARLYEVEQALSDDAWAAKRLAQQPTVPREQLDEQWAKDNPVTLQSPGTREGINWVARVPRSGDRTIAGAGATIADAIRDLRNRIAEQPAVQPAGLNEQLAKENNIYTYYDHRRTP